MERASFKSASSAAPAKKPSTFNNTDGFTADSIPPNHYHLGVDNYAVISDFGDVINVHIRNFRTDENAESSQPKMVLNFHLSCGRPCRMTCIDFPYHRIRTQEIIIRNTLFLASAWLENVPCVSLQRYVTKQDFSRQFLPSVCLLTETEWYQLQCIRKKISESCKSLMFNNFLKKKILLEVFSRSPRINLQMELSDVEMLLSMSLTKLLADNIESRIENVLVCKG
ncbi:hypothetical protein AVEN_77308-1 [Araneus ventricosus]|uniref:Uncharacterized protein n=1 Tax=Araneus ventricosus TaxID=182803 RepID=A0A4Y2NR00_ARAVE|nr:hypothetical protein AVEN_77308-1 [Araneus ventricosus]